MKAAAQKANYLSKVREQYEALPYPPYDPQTDRVQLTATAGDRLDYLNHRFWDGRRVYDTTFRALSAGDGTGNSSVYLAEQLREHGGQVVSLDLSSASQAIAKERARIRKLTNITHINASLLDIPTMGLGEFDYICCSGVLHHLADPDAGLRALASALKPSGVMCIMVYATIGRTAVYQMQDMLRLMINDDMPMDEQLALTRQILANLPRSNWFWFNNAPFLRDITMWGDSGIFDLLLHTQDRAYTVPEAYEWTEKCGLQLAEFCPMQTHHEIVYNPVNYTAQPDVLAAIKTLSLPERQALAELLVGLMPMHIFYAHKGDVATELQPTDHTLIPSIAQVAPIPASSIPDLCNALRNSVGKEILTFKIPAQNINVSIVPRTTTAALLEAINDERTIGDILHHAANQHPNIAPQQIEQEWLALYNDMRHQLMVVLRRSGSSKITPVLALHKRAAAQMDR